MYGAHARSFFNARAAPGQPFKLPPVPYVVADHLSIDDPVSIEEETPLVSRTFRDHLSNGRVRIGFPIGEARKARVRHVRRSHE